MKPTRLHKGKNLKTLPPDYTIIDIETTGLNPEYSEIIEIGALKVRDNIPIDEFNFLIKPTGRISPFITSLTGITEELVEYAPDINYVLPEFIEFIEDDVLVGHNVNFDLAFLYDNASLRINHKLSNDYVDSLYLARKYVKGLPSYKLTSLADYFGIIQDSAHRALDDCKTTHSCICAIMSYMP